MFTHYLCTADVNQYDRFRDSVCLPPTMGLQLFTHSAVRTQAEFFLGVGARLTKKRMNVIRIATDKIPTEAAPIRFDVVIYYKFSCS